MFEYSESYEDKSSYFSLKETFLKGFFPLKYKNGSEHYVRVNRILLSRSNFVIFQMFLLIATLISTFGSLHVNKP